MDTDPQPDDQAARLEFGRRLFAQECRFVAGAMTLDALPPPDLPEVAFAGRSNVGKSSLVNALTGRRTLARVSHTPGRTQQINFFELGGRLVLVDLPGYGYSQAGKAKAALWSQTVRLFLKGRPTLRRVCLLIDARHGPNAHDRDTMEALDEAAVNYQAVLTKVDKVKPEALERERAALARELAKHTAAHPVIMPTSAHAGTGVAELRAELAALAVDSPFG
ncbi:MAG: ribosome biogenesis GTP-binding protein YihA/YsxC [Alphaproteobacteria bacterium]|nr:ribosome biogenesis GTP-binding protein YihA/YsxC [Alphaproteobacteria bacterium]